jgi:alpha-tubulin suppressor-like RCC1 family protein
MRLKAREANAPGCWFRARLIVRHHAALTTFSAGIICGVLLELVSPIIQAATVTKVAGGGFHSLFVESDGSLWGMGDNGAGEVGAGFGVLQANSPIRIIASNVTTIAAGHGHSLFRMVGGSLWAMGLNDLGQLGDGTRNFVQRFPEQVVSNQVTVIGAGFGHSLFGQFHSPLGPGALWAMGQNDRGELGDGADTNHIFPEQIFSSDIGSAVLAVAAGHEFSLFLKPDGSLWGMGFAAHGELGDDARVIEINRPERIVASGVTAIAAGWSFTLFIKSDGSLWATGDNFYGQLGDNSTFRRVTPEQVAFNGVTAIAAGYAHSLFVKSDGSLWGMGHNAYGQLGDGTTNNHAIPIRIVASNVVALAAGLYHSLFVKSDGSLWAMGWNEFGQLGDGTTNNREIPVQIVPLPQPMIRSITLAGTNLVIHGSNVRAGETSFTLTSTDVARPLNQWIPVATNPLNATGDFTITATNAVDRSGRQQFFILQVE